MARSISIRQSLLRSLVLVILLLSGALLAATFLAARRTISLVSSSLITRTREATAAGLGEFFGPLRRDLLRLRGWGEAGLLDTGDPAQLNRLLLPILAQHLQISSLMIADARGREHLLLRGPEGWSTRQTRPDEWPGRARWLTYPDSGVEPEETWKEIDYDARSRPWYRGAVARAASEPDGGASVHWTEASRLRSPSTPATAWNG